MGIESQQHIKQNAIRHFFKATLPKIGKATNSLTSNATSIRCRKIIYGFPQAIAEC